MVRAGRLTGAAALLGAIGFTLSAAQAAPVKIRVGWVVVPFEVIPVLFQNTDLLKHDGVSYDFEPVHFQSASTALIAVASGDLEVLGLTPLVVATAIENAKLDDLRAVGDEYEDGVQGYYSNGFRVANDGPVKTIDDLKGKAVVTLGIGSSADLAIRVMLLKHGIVATRDYAELQAAPQNMKAMLDDGKAALIATAGLTSHDPDLLRTTHVLFSRRDAFGGPSQEATFFMRAPWIAEHRAAVVDFLEDYLRALRWFADPSHHEDAVRMIASFTKTPPDRFESWIFTADDEYRDLNGIPNLASLQRVLNLLKESGIVPAVPDVEKYADLGPVREAAARLK
jgi:NitT/TauT family transport system substrate-binding protein